MSRTPCTALVAAAVPPVLPLSACKSGEDADPRTTVRLVQVAEVRAAADAEHTYTGVVAARVQSDLGFRVPGKIIERLVDTGQLVRRGQRLMLMDATDYTHAITVQTGDVAAARARWAQAAADEQRYRGLAESGAISQLTYDQAKAAADSAQALLSAAEAQEKVARDQGGYSTLLADADAIVVETLAEPGQVVSPGQPVLRLAHAGPREASVNLPETERPKLGARARASLYADSLTVPAHLRQLSDAADPCNRPSGDAMRRVNLSALAVREGPITLFLISGLTLAGIYAFVSLGRAGYPPFTTKTLTVTAVWPGATAQEMQDLVADPLEKRLQELHWYDRVETFTRPGVVQMMLNLKDQTPPSEVPEQFYQARKKLGDEARNLPLGVLGPFVNDEYSDVEFALYAVEAHNMPARLLVLQADSLRERLLHVAGVKKVTILGERPERIFVNFSYARLANLGGTPPDAFAPLQNQNAITPAASIETTRPQVFVRLAGAFDDLQKIRDTPIVAGGRLLTLSDT